MELNLDRLSNVAGKFIAVKADKTLTYAAKRLVAMQFESEASPEVVAELVRRLQAAEAECAGYKKTIGAEVLRLQAGDVVVFTLDEKWVGGSAEYDHYRNGLMSVLPAGVQGIVKVGDIDIAVLTDEKLSEMGLVKAQKAVPEGWKLVPVVPTVEMLDNVDCEVGGSCYSCSPWKASRTDSLNVWNEMISAVPDLELRGS